MVRISNESVEKIGAVLIDSKKPLKERFRALFSLKNVNGPAAVKCISEAFDDPSALLKHELAYCLGQMKDKSAIPVLINVLEDSNQEAIVRHEAAEALGAIGDIGVEEILRKHTADESREVRETCELALQRLSWLASGGNGPENPYHSIDPAPPLENSQTIEQLGKTLMDESLPLFERYRAMFALRNLATPQSALALTTGLKTDSSLFSHEIAFVLGQLQDKVTIPALVDCLEDTSQNEMVRHECAEALGAIGTEECYAVLNKFLSDEKRVVRESCVVALDMCDYENSSEYEYALV